MKKSAVKTMGRREFVGGLVAAAGLAPFRGFPAVVRLKNPNSMLSHACIGLANQAKSDLHQLRSHRRLHITAICDVDQTFVGAVRELAPDARIYRDWHEMMEVEGRRIDSVNVSTPDHTHATIIGKALRRGLNVYAQKPLCRTVGECRALDLLAANRQAITQLGTQIAANACDRQTVALLQSGVIGEIRHVWLFSQARDLSNRKRNPRPAAAPVPATLDWKVWLGPAAFRPYAEKVYHPRAWRAWKDFGSSWIGDLGSHLMSPVWLGLRLGWTEPLSVRADVCDDGWSDEVRRLFWPRMVHVTWRFPGVKATGGKPFEVEWCDGSRDPKSGTLPAFLPPESLAAVAAKTPAGKLPVQGRVIEGAEGWIVSTHYDTPPAVVLKNGRAAPPLPDVGKAPSHYHEYVDCCLNGCEPRSSFSWTTKMTEALVLGNEAQNRPGVELKWKGGVLS